MDACYDVAVIGGGPGGYTAALYCARAGFSVAVVEKLSAGGQMATTDWVDNYPGFDEGVDGFGLGEKMQRGAERFGAVTIYDEVTAVDLTCDPKRLTLAGGALTARAVILATGALPRTLGLPEEEALRSRGVSYCATCDGMFYKGKAVAVCGGGNSAVEEALFLSKLCAKVTLIHRRDSLRAASVYVRQLKDSGVEILWNSRVRRLLPGDRLTGLELERTDTGAVSTLPCDGLFVAVGRVPDTGLFRGQVELDTQGYLVADDTTRTRLPGVFAVGDARTKPLRQIVTAAADGAVASRFVEEYLLSHSAP